MSVIDSNSGKVVRNYSIEELIEAANLMRGYDLVALHAAGSGHAGGTLSIMDITAALYLKIANHDPKNPNWSDRDRIIWSTGHKAPSLYLGLAFAGFCTKEDVVTLRKLSSPFQGHPHWLKLPGVEVSTGSLGQGLSIAVGMALAARLDGKNHKIFCIMGDGEQQEGQVWEAAMEAGHYALDNLIGIIDCNRLQIDGLVKDVMEVEPLADKYRSFGWDVLCLDGHDMGQIVDAFETGSLNERPSRRVAGPYGERQRRQLHGGPGGLAREDAKLRRVDEGTRGTESERSDSVATIARSSETVSSRGGPQARSQDAKVHTQLLVEFCRQS